MNLPHKLAEMSKRESLIGKTYRLKEHGLLYTIIAGPSSMGAVTAILGIGIPEKMHLDRLDQYPLNLTDLEPYESGP